MHNARNVAFAFGINDKINLFFSPLNLFPFFSLFIKAKCIQFIKKENHAGNGHPGFEPTNSN